MAKQLLVMGHDGGVDDYLSVMLLMAMAHIQVLGIVVTPADCYIRPAVSATRKILDLMGRSEVPVAASTVRGVNPFPRIFRRDAFSVDHFPILNERPEIKAPLAPEPGQAFLARLLREAPEPVTCLETGPLTTLAAALDLDPSLEKKIKEIVWMGGALNVPGNIDKIIEGGQDGSAEWNVYWDPIAADRLWRTSIPIIICPLDLTNHVPITSDFVMRLARQRRYPISDLAGLCYALVTHQDYFAWDVLTTSYIGQPDMFQLREWETAILTEGPSQGRTQIQSGGRKIRALDKVDLDRFYAYIFQQWSR
ncbi:MAG: inosine/uridine-preferring nucleoside hydrolase [Anaerolineales bacterium]|nr:inosine/uridine-preferring nucleoside hydrolase [Anaerolineales bacterium]